MDIRKVAQRIHAIASNEPILAIDAIELAEILDDEYEVTRGTWAEHGRAPSLALIARALNYGEDEQWFETPAVTSEDFSVMLCSLKSPQRHRSMEELLSTPGMFVGTKGIEHAWNHYATS